MTLRRLRDAGGSILLSIVGMLAAVATLPRLALSSTLPACVTESAGTAWLGLHLRLLAASDACPQGSYAPGPHYAEIAQFSIVLSLSAVAAGLIALALALGLGIWARQALREAREWVRARLSALRPSVTVITRRPPELPEVVLGSHGALLTRLCSLRGPPVPVLA